MANNQHIRIIAGQWRGRKLVVPNVAGLRPTADRTRETLFNWLQNVIVGARCLDLFAGTGALGLEALSRGAADVVFVDSSSVAVHALRHVLQQWYSSADVHEMSAVNYLRTAATQPFDIIFLDPPFQHQTLAKIWPELNQSACIGSKTKLYLEQEATLTWSLPKPWTLLKHKYAGQVHYALWRQQSIQTAVR